ncbi:hypothetical protein L2729_19590 [Shewanella gelidimarina]|uniref:hypothetical protein n=1 Tax=Shewanella gelidimarina TaxID=56813 RepID=UPI00200CE20B|nr:hypothetical protein [Shewanella gelidimarina]MCL1060175.1 hypothetical protein [Shewanella gelidimarina]
MDELNWGSTSTFLTNDRVVSETGTWPFRRHPTDLKGLNLSNSVSKVDFQFVDRLSSKNRTVISNSALEQKRTVIFQDS